MKYVCEVCGWEYDEELGAPEHGIAPGTRFEDLPEDFVCPLCGVDKENFSKSEYHSCFLCRFCDIMLLHRMAGACSRRDKKIMPIRRRE